MAHLRVFRTSFGRWDKVVTWRADMVKRGWRLLRVSSETEEIVAVFRENQDLRGRSLGAAGYEPYNNDPNKGCNMSPRRPILLAALSLSLIGSWALTAPKTTKYKVEIKAENIADLSALGQGEQKTITSLVNFLTITLDDTAGGQTVHAVLDSMIKADSNPMPDQSVLDSARGRTWHGLLSPEGKVTNVTRLDSSSAGPVGEIITTFFPRVKRGAKVGDQWTDTAEVITDQAPQMVTTKTITNYSVTGTETRNGARVLRIEAAFSQAQTGEINAMGGSLNVEGTGQGTAIYYVTPDNRYLGGTSTTVSDLQITSEQLPEPIPVKSTNTVTVTVLP